MKEDFDSYKPRVRALLKAKKLNRSCWPITSDFRDCLRCGKEFLSKSFANRLCTRCKVVISSNEVIPELEID